MISEKNMDGMEDTDLKSRLRIKKNFIENQEFFHICFNT